MPWTNDGVGYQPRDTSKAAADDMGQHASTIRARVIGALKAYAPHPLSSEELAQILALDYGSVQPRTSELARDGKIKDSGARVMGRFGKQIIAWELA